MSVRYLRVIGRLYRDGRLQLRACYLTATAPWSDREGSGDSPLAVDLHAGSGDLLARYPLRVYSSCAFGRRNMTDAVRAWVPFHPETRTIRFMSHGRIVHELRRAERPPELQLRWNPPALVEGRQRVAWEARAADNRALQFFVRYSHDGGRTWRRVGWRTDAREMLVDFDHLPGGERCLLGVAVTDGIDTVQADSSPFRVRLQPCHALILAPIDGSDVPSGMPVEFLGQGFWPEEARVERGQLEWTSSLDGHLGRGPSLRRDRLTDGEHRITLTCGEGDRQGSQSVTISVKGRQTR